jgi:hypothetical protein
MSRLPDRESGKVCNCRETARSGRPLQNHPSTAYPATDGCLTVLGAWLRKRFNMSHSQCYVAEASASQIGSGVVSGVDLYSIVKELVGTAEPRPQNGFRVAPERDQGVARGPGGPPSYGAETAKRFGDCALRGCRHLATLLNVGRSTLYRALVA